MSLIRMSLWVAAGGWFGAGLAVFIIFFIFPWLDSLKNRDGEDE